jgi:hypothetical protein
VWFLRTFYRNAIGFLGWDLDGPSTVDDATDNLGEANVTKQ